MTKNSLKDTKKNNLPFKPSIFFSNYKEKIRISITNNCKQLDNIQLLIPLFPFIFSFSLLIRSRYKEQFFSYFVKETLPGFCLPHQNMSWETFNEITSQKIVSTQNFEQYSSGKKKETHFYNTPNNKTGFVASTLPNMMTNVNSTSPDLIERLDIYSNYILLEMKPAWEEQQKQLYIDFLPKKKEIDLKKLPVFLRSPFCDLKKTGNFFRSTGDVSEACFFLPIHNRRLCKEGSTGDVRKPSFLSFSKNKVSLDKKSIDQRVKVNNVFSKQYFQQKFVDLDELPLKLDQNYSIDCDKTYLLNTLFNYDAKQNLPNLSNVKGMKETFSLLSTRKDQRVILPYITEGYVLEGRSTYTLTDLHPRHSKGMLKAMLEANPKGMGQGAPASQQVILRTAEDGDVKNNQTDLILPFKSDVSSRFLSGYRFPDTERVQINSLFIQNVYKDIIFQKAITFPKEMSEKNLKIIIQVPSSFFYDFLNENDLHLVVLPYITEGYVLEGRSKSPPNISALTPFQGVRGGEGDVALTSKPSNLCFAQQTKGLSPLHPSEANTEGICFAGMSGGFDNIDVWGMLESMSDQQNPKNILFSQKTKKENLLPIETPNTTKGDDLSCQHRFLCEANPLGMGQGAPASHKVQAQESVTQLNLSYLPASQTVLNKVLIEKSNTGEIYQKVLTIYKADQTVRSAPLLVILPEEGRSKYPSNITFGDVKPIHSLHTEGMYGIYGYVKVLLTPLLALSKSSTILRAQSFRESWEPVTFQSWLAITKLSFAFFVFKFLQYSYTNYGRDLLIVVLRFLDENLKERLGLTDKKKDKGYRLIKKVKKAFKDVAGIDNILPELGEMVWVLRNSGNGCGVTKARQTEGLFQLLLPPKTTFKFGNLLPKGFLFVGPPGTGKTFLVQAIAGEAGVPVLVQSGSSLTGAGENEKGAQPLKKMFEEARKLAPCIVFIDEIDTLGKSRQNVMRNSDAQQGTDDLIQSLHKSNQSSQYITEGYVRKDHRKRCRQILKSPNKSNINVSEKFQDTQKNQDGNQEKQQDQEQLNLLMQLLIELDGLKYRKGVIVIGATNRPRVLDPALTRPGRFDRVLSLEFPEKQKRIEILKLYSQNIGLADTLTHLHPRHPLHTEGMYGMLERYVKKVMLKEDVKSGVKEGMSKSTKLQFPWEYLANLTFGFSAADLAAAMNQSSIQAILRKTGHTIETVEQGIESITSYSIEKPKMESEKSQDFLYIPNFRQRLEANKETFYCLDPSLHNRRLCIGRKKETSDYNSKGVSFFLPIHNLRLCKEGSQERLVKENKTFLQVAPPSLLLDVRLPKVLSFQKSKEKKDPFFLTRVAYSQAGKGVLHTLLPEHPDVIILKLWPQPKNSRHKDVSFQLTSIDHRAKLETRLIGLYAGKAAELLFLCINSHIKKENLLLSLLGTEKKDTIPSSAYTKQPDISDISDISALTPFQGVRGGEGDVSEAVGDVKKGFASNIAFLTSPVDPSLHNRRLCIGRKKQASLTSDNKSSICQAVMSDVKQKRNWQNTLNDVRWQIKKKLNEKVDFSLYEKRNLSHSNLEIDELSIASNLAHSLVDKWFFYSNKITLRKENQIFSNQNTLEFSKIELVDLFQQLTEEVQKLVSASNISENSMRDGRDKHFRSKSSFQEWSIRPWWQNQITKEIGNLNMFYDDWYRIYLPDPQESERNGEWVIPDEYYHNTQTLKNILPFFGYKAGFGYTDSSNITKGNLCILTKQTKNNNLSSNIAFGNLLLSNQKSCFFLQRRVRFDILTSLTSPKEMLAKLASHQEMLKGYLLLPSSGRITRSDVSERKNIFQLDLETSLGTKKKIKKQKILVTPLLTSLKEMSGVTKDFQTKNELYVDITWNDLYKIDRDYIYHALIITCFNKAFSLLDDNRELLDYLADYLMRFETLRQHKIKEIFCDFGDFSLTSLKLTCSASFTQEGHSNRKQIEDLSANISC